MARPIAIEGKWTASELRRLAASSKHANQSRRLLSLAAVLDGMNRTEAARIGGMDRQTLRDWVHRFNERGPEGLKDDWVRDKPRRFNAAQRAELTSLVTTGPDRAVHGVCAGSASTSRNWTVLKTSRFERLRDSLCVLAEGIDAGRTGLLRCR